ncbi:hypothetical protein PM082_000556 [Marasmius tenuissimus]|nr:hypothetical protein PM082_000556 [Marasmius tenuissimus]
MKALLSTMVPSTVSSVLCRRTGTKAHIPTTYIDDQLDNWQKLYYGNHYDKLKAIKSQYDPSNMFAFPTSVEEGSGDSGNGAGNGNGSGSGSESKGARTSRTGGAIQSETVLFSTVTVGVLSRV